MKSWNEALLIIIICVLLTSVAILAISTFQGFSQSFSRYFNLGEEEAVIGGVGLGNLVGNFVIIMFALIVVFAILKFKMQ